MTTTEQSVERALVEWLSDPVRVFASVNRLLALACLVAALVMGGLPGLALAFIGTLTMRGVSAAERTRP